MSIYGPLTFRLRKGWPVALAALAAALASALLVGGARSAPPASGLIAFTRHDGIYVMRADGTGVRALRRGGVASSAFGLAWSPDRSKLALVAHEGNQTAIWVMSAKGTDLSRLAVGQAPGGRGYLVALGSPTWSHDGRMIAFTAYDSEVRDRDIWVMDADGSNLHRLLRTPRRFEIGVAWSPAGDRLAFWGDGYIPRVYVMNADGSDLRTLTPRRFMEPSWSPDGRRIAFVRLGRSRLDDEIYVGDASGRSRVRLTNSEVLNDHPVWSPDGRRIAFLGSRAAYCWGCPVERRGSSEIYVINADGTGLTRLTHNSVGEATPAWQPVALP